MYMYLTRLKDCIFLIALFNSVAHRDELFSGATDTSNNNAIIPDITF